jgi:hypothetical protein
LPGDALGDPPPTDDDGLNIPGDGTFNTPPVVEAADTPPFFHNNARATIEEAVAFYNSDAFNTSPAGQVGRISLTDEQVRDIAAFLRALNALENIRQSEAYLRTALERGRERGERPVVLAGEEIQDAIEVLSMVGMSADAVIHLRNAKAKTGWPTSYDERWRENVDYALAALQLARSAILAPASAASTSSAEEPANAPN